MQSRLEKDIEREVTGFATSLSILQVKLNLAGQKGWPDRMYLYKGRTAFVEYKRPGEAPEPIQLHIHKLLREQDFPVFVIDNADYGITIIKRWKGHVDTELARLR